MAEQKIFAGPRIRRLRMERGLTQTAMAEGLGISPSYLNLIERNQRPITVQLILKLAATYRIDPGELQGETRSSVAALKEVFSDPLLVGELPGDQELIDLAETAPNASTAMLKLFRAYREQAERLSDLNALLAGEGRATTLSAARLPVDEVREVFERRPWHFAGIEEAAEAFAAALDSGDDLFAALKAWLRREHGISVRPLPAVTMPNWRRRYDRHSQRLFLSERLSRVDQLREVAMEACLIRMREVLAEEVAGLKLSSDEARRLARFELARYASLALMLPYAPFHQVASRARYDIAVLAARFGVSFEQAATRLVALQRAGAVGVPFFLMEIDSAGNRLRRLGAQGFPHAAFGGGCPKLAVHDAFAEPGRVLAEAVEMPDGAAFLCIVRTVDGPEGGFGERPRRTALLLACDMSLRDQTVYGAALPSAPPTPVGPACRLCERAGCLARAEPPVTRPLGLDEMVTGLSAFDFQ
ncbi:short-chain fatty acyl-CoA regulator family protein [Mesorhizobium sp. KR9-304]|uniref:helix-turn-helix domain-containing protein n=1 Tax=Mesorhizobium sp. KR9-304 TaxID=3156614 RepID=UPI0032B531A5